MQVTGYAFAAQSCPSSHALLVAWTPAAQALLATAHRWPAGAAREVRYLCFRKREPQLYRGLSAAG